MKDSPEKNRKRRSQAPNMNIKAPITIEIFTPKRPRTKIDKKLLGMYMRKYAMFARFDPKIESL